MSPTALDELAAIEHIKRLKTRYCRYVDSKQWARLRGLFTDDVRFEGLGSAPNGATLDAFITGISTRFHDAVSIHYCPNADIVLTGANTARGVWSMMDYVQWPAGFSPREAPNARGFRGFGHYEEEYRCDDGVWRIAFLRLTRLRIDPVGIESPEPAKDLLALSPDWLGIHASEFPPARE